jgi:flavorubredoxin
MSNDVSNDPSNDPLAGVPDVRPFEIAPDTYLIPNLFPAGPDVFVPANTMVIRGAEPVVVDTGAPVHRELWLEKTFSVVEPEDVRWVFLSHDDGDHTGSLEEVLARCPNATLVTNFFSMERLGLDARFFPPQRMKWVNEGESLDVGDRTLHLFKPPIFDGPTTRGLYDPTTATMWAVDSFACLTPGSLDVHELPREHVAENMPAMNSLVSPWHQWLDPVAYRRHVDDVEALGVLTVASAHGPVLTGDAVREAFEGARALAGRPLIPGPGQELLDEIINQVLAAA